MFRDSNAYAVERNKDRIINYFSYPFPVHTHVNMYLTNYLYSHS